MAGNGRPRACRGISIGADHPGHDRRARKVIGGGLRFRISLRGLDRAPNPAHDVELIGSADAGVEGRMDPVGRAEAEIGRLAHCYAARRGSLDACTGLDLLDNRTRAFEIGRRDP